MSNDKHEEETLEAMLHRVAKEALRKASALIAERTEHEGLRPFERGTHGLEEAARLIEAVAKVRAVEIGAIPPRSE